MAEMAVHNPFDFFLEPEAEEYPSLIQPSRRMSCNLIVPTDANAKANGLSENDSA